MQKLKLGQQSIDSSFLFVWNLEITEAGVEWNKKEALFLTALPSLLENWAKQEIWKMDKKVCDGEWARITSFDFHQVNIWYILT